MKAETILKLIERAREPMLKEAHLKAYAQSMIEKDREMVKKSFTTGSQEAIDDIPIILD